MTSFIQRLIADDFVWSAVTKHLPSKRRHVNGVTHINCPMCVLRGEKNPDRKMRCGIKFDAQGLAVHCFNCGFICKWSSGQLLSRNLRKFLIALGMVEYDVKQLNVKALQYRKMFAGSPEALALLPENFIPTFEPRPLPPGSKEIGEWVRQSCINPDFIEAVTYLYSRGDDIAENGKFYWSPDPKFSRRIIVPFFHDGQIVGWTARAIDKTAPSRYVMESQTNFLFNAKALTNPHRKYVILVEGVFDALALDCVGMLGSHLNAQQIAWIKCYGKTVIMLPDRDARGDAMIDIALQNGFMVSYPVLDGTPRKHWWDNDVGDAAEATKRYGRLWTLLSVLETATEYQSRIMSLRKMYIVK